jgi:hypothetical protein
MIDPSCAGRVAEWEVWVYVVITSTLLFHRIQQSEKYELAL